MQNKLIGLMISVIVAAGSGFAGTDSQEVRRDAAYIQAKEQMTDLLASEEFEKIDVSAASFDRAMTLIYTAVETYLDRAIPAFGDVEAAQAFGVDVLQGLNDHKIRVA